MALDGNGFFVSGLYKLMKCPRISWLFGVFKAYFLALTSETLNFAGPFIHSTIRTTHKRANMNFSALPVACLRPLYVRKAGSLKVKIQRKSFLGVWELMFEVELF